MEFRVLGPLEVVGGGRPAVPGAPKENVVLAALLITLNQVVSVDRLADAIWGDGSPRTAEKTVQTYVLRLRRRLAAMGDDATIETSPPGYVLRAAPASVDAHRFETLAARGREHLQLGRGEEAAEDLRSALSLWRGTPYEELGPVGQAEAVRLGELRLSALEDRCDAALSLGRHRELVGELETLVREHPLRERFWGQLMLALYRSRRQAEALRAYQRARATLTEELGIEPGPALRQLEQAVLEQDRDLDVVAPARPDLGATGAHPSSWAWLHQASTGTTSFVGREPEVRHLSEAWERARQGNRQLVLVSGEPGIGKTRLALELASRVDGEGATVMFGRCDDEMLVPYQPFAEALSQRADGFQEELPFGRPEPGPERADPDTERLRLFQRVTQLLAAAAAEEPVLLVLDDIHWATKPTLLMLKHVAERMASAPLLILGTFRDTEASDALAPTLADLWRNEGVSRVALTGLTEDDVVALVATNPIGASGASAHAGAIWAETSGNPFFVNEMVRHIAGDRSDGGRRASLPASVREVIGRRVQRLPEQARNVLDLASVIGRHFSLEVLAAAGDLSDGEAVEAMEAAAAAGLVDENTEAVDRYRFVHALVRDALLGQLSGSRRARLHHRVATALEALDTGTSAAPAVIAHHYAEAGPAGDVGKAVRYLRLAAEQALSQLAYEDAVGHLDRALKLLNSESNRSDLERCRLLLVLGDAVGKAADPLREQEAFLEAARMASAHAYADELVAAARGLARALSWGGAAQGQAFAFIEEALCVLSESDGAARAQLLGRQARCMFLSGSAEQRAAISARALAMARRHGDPSVLGPVLNDWHWAAMGPDWLDERLEVADELLALGAQLNSRDLAASAHRWRLCDRLEAGDLEGAAREAAAVTVISAEEGRTATSYDVMRATWEGRFSDADSLITDMSRQRLNMNEFDTNDGNVLVMRWLQGRFAETAQLVESSAAVAPYVFLGSLGMLFLTQGRTDEARDLVDRLTAGSFDEVPRNIFWYPQVAAFAAVCADLGHVEGAACLYRLLAPFATRNCVAGLYAFAGTVDHWLGALAATAGDLRAASRHFDAGLARYEHMRAKPWWALAARSYATALTRAAGGGDAPRARELLARARSIDRELGTS